MKLATISSVALTNAANHLRLVGDQAAADALLDLTDGYDALVIEGGEPLPQPLKIVNLDRAAQLAIRLAAARRDTVAFEAVKPEQSVDVRFWGQPGPCQVFKLDTEDSHASKIEAVELMEVVAEHLKKRVIALESQLRALGVDPSL